MLCSYHKTQQNKLQKDTQKIFGGDGYVYDFDCDDDK